MHYPSKGELLDVVASYIFQLGSDGITPAHDSIIIFAFNCTQQGSKKDNKINKFEQNYHDSAKELSALRCTHKIVRDERDASWQESKQMRRTVSGLQNEVALLRQKIRALDEDLRLKESEILLREGEISILCDIIDKSFDIICIPRSMKQFGME